MPEAVTMAAPSRRRSLVLPIACAIVCGALAVASAGDPRWHDALDYRRTAIAAGEGWRLVTAHAMHLSVSHAVLDIAALLLVAWIFCGRSGPLPQAALGLFAIVVIDASLWWLHPEVDRYVGLSGVLHAGFVAGAVGWIVASGTDRRAIATRRWGAVLLVALAIKLHLESRQQAFWLAGDPFPVVTAAHRWGALAGIVARSGMAVVARLGRLSRPPRPPRPTAAASSPVPPARGR